MTFIKDAKAYKTAQLLAAAGYMVIASIYLKKAYGR
jgi:hypothetical protein